MRCLLALPALAAAAAAGALASAVVHDPAAAPPGLIAAFAQDGFTVSSAVTYEGNWGLAGVSVNGTIGTTGLHKTLYYVSGSGYQQGYLRGFIAPSAVEAMMTTYLQHIVPSLLDPELDQWLQNSTFAPTYDTLLTLLEDLLVSDAVGSFNTSFDAGTIPQELVDEMRGIADGVRAVNASTATTFDKLVTLNYGYDYLLALIYTGNIWEVLGDKLVATGAGDERAAAAVRAIPPSFLRPPLACDAFAARGAATRGGNGSIFARDFQFATALVFQDVQAPTVHVPTDGRQPIVNVGAPGFVGAMTAMNAAGVAMGVDVLQAGFANTSVVGLNSLLLVRATIDRVTTSAAAVDFIVAAARGVSWLYPLSDASGDGRIIETGPKVFNGSILPDYRAFVTNATVAAALPDPAYLATHVEPWLDHRFGAFIRNMSVAPPLESTIIPDYNPQLFALAGVQAPPASAYAANGSVWTSWQAEEVAYPTLYNRYFSPTHTPLVGQDLIAVSNLALVPHLRIAGMNFWCEITDMGSPQWRYDTLVQQALAAIATNGGIDYAAAKNAISFLSPTRTPGFNGPIVGGIMTVADLQARRMGVKGGFWIDSFVDVTLPNYL